MDILKINRCGDCVYAVYKGVPMHPKLRICENKASGYFKVAVQSYACDLYEEVENPQWRDYCNTMYSD
jgi:hypothetical protein